MPVNFDELCDLLRRFAAERYPGHRGAAFRVVLADGSRLVVPVGGATATPVAITPAATPAAPTAGQQPRLSESLLEILQAFQEAAPGERLTAGEVARRVGCEPHSRFRDRMAHLVRLGLIASSMRDGYTLLPAGRDVPTGEP
jgi:hypothetical protein